MPISSSIASTSLPQKLPVLAELRPLAGPVTVCAENALEVEFGGHDRAGLGPLVRPDDPPAFERVDDPTRPRVAYPETPLHGAHGGLPGRHDEARCLRQERVVGLF